MKFISAVTVLLLMTSISSYAKGGGGIQGGEIGGDKYRGGGGVEGGVIDGEKNIKKVNIHKKEGGDLPNSL